MADINQLIKMYSSGDSYQIIGDSLGISKQRVGQILLREISRKPILKELREMALIRRENEKKKAKLRVCINCGRMYDPLYGKNRRFCSAKCVGSFFKNCLVNKTITKKYDKCEEKRQPR